MDDRRLPLASTTDPTRHERPMMQHVESQQGKQLGRNLLVGLAQVSGRDTAELTRVETLRQRRQAKLARRAARAGR